VGRGVLYSAELKPRGGGVGGVDRESSAGGGGREKESTPKKKGVLEESPTIGGSDMEYTSIREGGRALLAGE